MESMEQHFIMNFAVAFPKMLTLYMLWRAQLAQVSALHLVAVQLTGNDNSGPLFSPFFFPPISSLSQPFLID